MNMLAYPLYFQYYIPKIQPPKVEKTNTSQSIRDHERIHIRISKLGSKVTIVSAYLEGIYGQKITFSLLLTYANDISRKLNIRLDRLARRYRQGILCWFAENWSAIHPLIQSSDYLHNLVKPQRKTEELNSNIDITDLNHLLNAH